MTLYGKCMSAWYLSGIVNKKFLKVISKNLALITEFIIFTEDPHYNDIVCYQIICCSTEFAVLKKLDVDPSIA